MFENISTLISLESQRNQFTGTPRSTEEISEASASLVNNFLELTLAAIGNQQVEGRSADLSTFLKLLLQIVGNLPVSNPKVMPVDC